MAIGVGQRCVVRIKITGVELRNAKDIVATVESPQYVAHCQGVSFDEVSGVVYVSVDVNSAGSYSMWLEVRFAEEVVYTPAFVFAEVEGEATPCDAPYIVDVEVSGESVSVTPPKIDVDAVTREEFEQLSKDVAGKVDKVKGKGLSTNDFTDEYKQKVDEFSGGGGGDFNKEGYYPDMSVGMADNLVGRGDVQDAQINFRPSAGAANITDGAARIERIKGNSVVWNQQFDTTINVQWSNVIRSDVSKNGHIVKATATADAGKFSSYNQPFDIVGHKAFISIKAKVYGTVRFGFYEGGDTIGMVDLQGNGEMYKCYEFIQSQINMNNIGGYIPTSGDYIEFDDRTIKIIDLTKMFGAGNEPTTVEEYYRRTSMNIEDEYAYNAGTLVDMKVDSLVSVSDNAYDYTKGYARVMGGYKYDITANAGATLEVSFYADGEDDNEEREIAPDSEGKYTFPANGICYVNGDFASQSDVCVCLNHSYNKPHPAYQQEVKDLSFISEVFPNGMRGVPKYVADGGVAIEGTDAYDEIRYNPTTKKWEAVQRVGKATNLTFANEGTNIFAAPITDIKRPSDYASRRSGFIANKYNSSYPVSISSMEDKSILRIDGVYNIYIKDTTYSTVAEFNEANKDLVIYYELAEPIVVELDYPTAETNMDYLVWDFGTEEATVPNNVPSAPFRADINYEPNAVDDLRWAVAEIRNLKAQLAQMQTSVTNLTE